MPASEPFKPSRRCAVYTRKSVQQDPAHQFGSLEAQRAICCSYIASQQPKGWVAIAKHYDDDGQSGSDLRRPALQELLSDIESGLIDVVVIYKLDRISRTLLDFVRLMDLMDQFGVGFVAVTHNYVAHSLEAALWCVGRTACFRDAVLLAANLGDDADTTAAITGQLAGALYGKSDIPAEWLDRLAWTDEIENLATSLFEASGR